MSTTREAVLNTILSQRRCTINELAEAVKINPISVRHHIAKLEADGLVDSEEERHGVGRPRRIYFLTDTGMELFPSRYLRLTSHLLDELKDSLSKSTITKLFKQLASGIVENHVAEVDLDELTEDERLELLKKLLANEGFTIEVERLDDRIIIKGTSCPYYHIGQEHPEVCLVDKTLISEVLATPASKIKCILDGDAHCAYVVPRKAKAEVIKLSEVKS